MRETQLMTDLLLGVKVLSFNHFLLGPLGTQHLADLGADVISVKPPTGAFQRQFKGFNIVVNGRADNEIMDSTCAEIEAKGVTAVKIPSDVSDPTQHARLIAEAEKQLGGPLYALVNNAGVGPLRKADILETQPDSWDHSMKK
jgi:hypothetical protein